MNDREMEIRADNRRKKVRLFIHVCKSKLINLYLWPYQFHITTLSPWLDWILTSKEIDESKGHLVHFKKEEEKNIVIGSANRPPYTIQIKQY